MNTFVYELVNSLDERWYEVDVLINKADSEQEDKDLYNVLCKSSIVLIVAHFEGFIKACAKAIIDDINKFSSYKKSPKKIKKSFCKQYVSGKTDRERDAVVGKLINIFDSLETVFVVEPFLFKSEDNSNPKPNVIETICENFGVNKFFTLIDQSILDNVFKGSRSDIEELLAKLSRHVKQGVKEFHYNEINLAEFDIKTTCTTDKKEKTFWETFLNELLYIRHSIAHGTSLENSLSIEDIKEHKNKIKILQYALIMILCDKLNCHYESLLPDFDLMNAFKITNRLVIPNGLSFESPIICTDLDSKHIADIAKLLKNSPEVISSFGDPCVEAEEDRALMWWEFAIFDGYKWQPFILDYHNYSIMLESGDLEPSDKKESIAKIIYNELHKKKEELNKRESVKS